MQLVLSMASVKAVVKN